MKPPSLERGCRGKINLGWSDYEEHAERFRRKRNKQYGVYSCPHCRGTHLTTKLEKRNEYPPLLYVTKPPTTMTKFTKDQLFREGQYLLFGPDRKFVARFKHGGPFTLAKFRKELIASHTPEQYFAELDAGKAPLTILKEKNPAWYGGVLHAGLQRALA